MLKRALAVLFSIVAFASCDARLLRGSAPPAAYEGLVSTRGAYWTSNFDTSNQYMQCRSAHVATENLSSIKIVIPNFAQDPGGGGFDAGVGAASTVLGAGIENSAGVTDRVAFSTSNTGTIADKSLLFADYTNVSNLNITAGTQYWVRLYIHNPVGVNYNQYNYAAANESFQRSATALTDLTQGSGTFTSTDSFSCGPIAILGMTVNPSVIIVGDSIAQGYNHGHDSLIVATYKQGNVAASLGNIPFVNLSAGGETAFNWTTITQARSQLIQKGSIIVDAMGINDLGSGQTAAQLESSINSIALLKAPFQKFYQTTVLPQSSDPGTPSAAFTTISQQTVGAHQTQRNLFNVALRGGTTGITGLTGFFDIAPAVEFGTGGLWNVTAGGGGSSATAPNTDDGTHIINAGTALIVNSGAINPAALTYP